MRRAAQQAAPPPRMCPPPYTHTAHIRPGASQKHFATSTAVPVWGLAPLVMAVLHCSVLPPSLLSEGTLDQRTTSGTMRQSSFNIEQLEQH